MLFVVVFEVFDLRKVDFIFDDFVNIRYFVFCYFYFIKFLFFYKYYLIDGKVKYYFINILIFNIC